MHRQAESAVSLAELLAVLGIIGALAMVGVPRYHWYTFYAGRAAMQVQMHQLAMAIRIQQDQGIAIPSGIMALTIASNAPICPVCRLEGCTPCVTNLTCTAIEG